MSKLSRSEVGKMGGLISREITALAKQARIDQYNLNPKLCLGCANRLTYDKRSNKFCNASCSTRFYNNQRAVNRIHQPICDSPAPTKPKAKECKYCGSTYEESCSTWCNRPQLYKSIYRNFKLDLTPYFGSLEFITLLTEFVTSLQKEYDNSSLPSLALKYGYSGHVANWAKIFNALGIKLNTRSQALRNYYSRNGYYDNITQKEEYYKCCRFEIKDYKTIPGYDLLCEHAWFHPLSNPKGVSRDHMFSVSEGFKQGVSADLIKHPANCRIVKHSENSSKGSKCSLTLDQLNDRIQKWCRMSDLN